MSVGSHQHANQPVSIASSFAPSSWSSSLGVSEALASYRRSQYIITGQNLPSSLDADSRIGPSDEEAVISEEVEETPLLTDEEELPTPTPIHDEVELEWDNVLESSDSRTPVVSAVESSGPGHAGLALPAGVGRLPPQIRLEARPHVGTRERTPLLRKTRNLQAPRLGEIEQDASQESSSYTILVPPDERDQSTRLRRKASSTSARSEKAVPAGRSTFGQTVCIGSLSFQTIILIIHMKLFNSIAILLGFGMLAEPLAFALSGWIGGSILIIFYGIITCYT